MYQPKVRGSGIPREGIAHAINRQLFGCRNGGQTIRSVSRVIYCCQGDIIRQINRICLCIAIRQIDRGNQARGIRCGKDL